MKKQNILLALAMFASFSLYACGGSSQNGGQTDTTTTDTTVVNPTPAPEERPTPPTVAKRFAYTAPEVKDGKLSAVVEMGATGFNSFIIQRDGSAWSLVKAAYGTSGVIEGATDDKAISEKLKAYIKELIDAGVPGKYIYFVVSSGAAKEPIVEQITRLLKEMKYVVNTVTPEQEAIYGYKATVPAEYEDKAFFVDMGSGNTKIAYKQGGKIVTYETYGTKYGKKDISDATAAQEVQALLAKVPENLRQHCFLIGGIPYDLAKFQHGGNVDARYITLAPSAEDYAGYAKANADNAKLAAGLNIYKAMLEGAKGCEYVVFDSKTNFTIGYLLGLKF